MSAVIRSTITEGTIQTIYICQSCSVHVDYCVWPVSIFEILGQYSIPGVAHDFWQHEYAPSCLPNTCADLMVKIWDWVNDKDGCPMCLLSGMAGP